MTTVVACAPAPLNTPSQSLPQWWATLGPGHAGHWKRDALNTARVGYRKHMPTFVLHSDIRLCAYIDAGRKDCASLVALCAVKLGGARVAALPPGNSCFSCLSPCMCRVANTSVKMPDCASSWESPFATALRSAVLGVSGARASSSRSRIHDIHPSVCRPNRFK